MFLILRYLIKEACTNFVPLALLQALLSDGANIFLSMNFVMHPTCPENIFPSSCPSGIQISFLHLYLLKQLQQHHDSIKAIEVKLKRKLCRRSVSETGSLF